MQAPLVSIFEALLVASRKGICLIPNVLVHKPEFFCETQDGLQNIERSNPLGRVLLDVDNKRTGRFECLHPGPDDGEHPVRVLIFRDATVGLLSLLRKGRGCHDQVRKLPSLFVQLGQDGQVVPVNDAVEFHSQLILTVLGNHRSCVVPAESGLHRAVRMMCYIASSPLKSPPKNEEALAEKNIRKHKTAGPADERKNKLALSSPPCCGTTKHSRTFPAICASEQGTI